MSETSTTIPPGFTAYGWHRFTSGSLSALWLPSAAHLVEGEGVSRPFPRALCGRGRRGRSTHSDTPHMVASELKRGDRKPCARCFAKAAGA